MPAQILGHTFCFSSLGFSSSTTHSNMRSFSVPLFSLLLITILGLPAQGSPHVPKQMIERKGGPSGGGGGDDGGSSGSGIPTVNDVKNPLCKPWIAVRDAIMGGLYQGTRFLWVWCTLTKTMQVAAETPPAPPSAWLSTTPVRTLIFGFW